MNSANLEESDSTQLNQNTVMVLLVYQGSLLNNYSHVKYHLQCIVGCEKNTSIDILLNIIFQAFILDRETKIVHDTFKLERYTLLRPYQEQQKQKECHECQGQRPELNHSISNLIANQPLFFPSSLFINN